MWNVELQTEHRNGIHRSYTYHAHRVSTVPQAIAAARHEWQTLSKRRGVRTRVTFRHDSGATLQTLHLERL